MVGLRERADAAFEIHHQADHDALHAAGRKVDAELVREQWRDEKPHHAIERTTRFLRPNEGHVDLARLRQASPHRGLRNLREGDALVIAVPQSERFPKVPRDGFALAVGIARDDDRVRAGHRFANAPDPVLTARKVARAVRLR